MSKKFVRIDSRLHSLNATGLHKALLHLTKQEINSKRNNFTISNTTQNGRSNMYKMYVCEMYKIRAVWNYVVCFNYKFVNQEINNYSSTKFANEDDLN